MEPAAASQQYGAYHSVARGIAMVLATAAVVALLGWHFDVTLVESIGQGLVVATVVGLALVIRSTRRALDRTEAARLSAEAEVRHLNLVLEQRVGARTAELEAANRHLLEEAETSESLAAAGEELIACLDGPRLLERLCEITRDAVGSDFSHAFLLDPKEAVYAPVTGCGDTPEQWAALQPLKVPHTMLTKLFARFEQDDVVQIRMAEASDLLPTALPSFFGITLTMYIALRRGQQIVGVLTAGFRGRQEFFVPKHERMGRRIAHLGGLALESARLLQQLEQANRLKSDFVATMSHELRTPLQHIIGYTSLLSEGEFDPPTANQRDALARVEGSALALLRLVEQVLDVNRFEKEQIAIEVGDVAVDDLARELESYARGLGRSDVDFMLDRGPATAGLRTDRAKLMVALTNVVGNAFKFTAAGAVGVTIRELMDGVEFAISDTGVGIAPENQTEIFEPFRQLEQHLTRQHGGVGLGLHLARSLVEMIGGTISVESTLGAGATFRIWVPQAPEMPRRHTRRESWFQPRARHSASAAN